MKRTLRIEVLLAVFLVFTLFVSIITLWAANKVKISGQKRIEDYREARMQEARGKLSGMVQTANSVLRYYNDLVSAGKLPLVEAQTLARNQIRQIRYDSTGYFWVNDANYLLIVQPPDPQLEGQDRQNVKDVHGKRMVKELVDIALAEGEAYVDYHFRKLNSSKPSPKLGHTIHFKPWGWIIGTGFYIDEIETEIVKKETELQRLSKETVQEIFIGAALGLVIVISFLSLIISYSMQTIQDLKNAVDAGIRGDLTKRVLKSRKNDIGDLLSSFNSFMNTLEEIITEVKDGASAMNHIAKAIHNANDILAEKSAIQASAVEETSSTLDEVQATVETNNKHTVSTQELSSLTAENARIATEHSKQLHLSMSAITDSSLEITEMLELIQEIAFQTHILSLNAGIEASKAGEHGRGFGVVANEIRSLAERTTIAGKQIGKLIKTNNIILEKGSREVNDTIDRLADISNKVATINKKISVVSLSANEQQRAVKQINKAIQEIDIAIQSNAQIAEETSAEASTLIDKAIGFSRLIDFFRLSDSNKK